MAGTKISELPTTSTLNDNDIIPVVQGGETKSVSLATLKDSAQVAPPAFVAASGSHISESGTPIVTARTEDNVTTLTFNYLKGIKGDKGDKGDKGEAGTSSIPIATVLPYFGQNLPERFLWCDYTEFDPAEYPDLYAELGDNHTPDLREVVLVGAGKNTTNIFDSTETDPNTQAAGTQAHDVYSVGEFKDDQFQGHQHEQYQATSNDEANWNGSYLITGWTWRDTRKIKNMADMTAARWGTTTHGKQVGCHYIIKAE